MKVSFNLVSEPWIPCIRGDGSTREISLGGLFRQAHKIREIRAQSPLVTVSIYRLLLAILHRVLGPPSLDAWAEIFKAGEWDLEALEAYLKKWQPRFDLFDEKYPFYQVSGMPFDKAKDGKVRVVKPGPSTKLRLELASGNNDTLFDHTTDDELAGLTPAEAAQHLLAIHNYGINNPQSATGAQDLGILMGAIIALIQGENIWETLTLNLVVYNAKDQPFKAGKDIPCWERSEPVFKKNAEARNPQGYIDYLTYNNRYIKLLPDTQGDKTRVRQVGIAQGDRFPKGWLHDQFMVYVSTKSGEIRPLRLQNDRALWRDSDALLGLREDSERGRNKKPENFNMLASLVLSGVIPPSKLYNINIFGLCNNKSAIESWRHERFPLPLGLLADVERLVYVAAAISHAEKTANLIRSAVYSLNKELTAVSDKPPLDSSVVLQSFWHPLEVPFLEFIQALPNSEPESVLACWSESVVRTAKKSFRAAIKKFMFTARGMKAATRAEMKLLSNLNKLQIGKDEK